MKKIIPLLIILTLIVSTIASYANATDNNEINIDFSDIESDYYTTEWLDAETPYLKINAVKSDWTPFFTYSDEQSDYSDWDPILIARDNIRDGNIFENDESDTEAKRYEQYYLLASEALGTTYGIDFQSDGEIAQDKCINNTEDYEFISLWIENHDNTILSEECTYTISNLENAFGLECGGYLHFYEVEEHNGVFSKPKELERTQIGIVNNGIIAMFTGKIQHLLIVCERSDSKW